MNTAGLIVFIINGFVILIVSIIIHEIGHILFLKLSGKTAELRISIKKDIGVISQGLDRKQKFNFYFIGIILGMLPVVISMYWNVLYSILMIPYLIGCKSDIKSIWGLRK